MLQVFSSITAAGIGLLSSLMTLVFLMAGLANAKPSNIQQGKWMMLGIAFIQVASLTASIWFMVRQKHWPASFAGLFPLVVVIVLITVLVKLEW